MSDINGDGTADVTNDEGTLNGASQGGPIDNIFMDGDDVVTVTNSTITGVIDTGGSSDSITVIDSTVGGVIDAGKSTDTVTIGGSSVSDVNLGTSNDILNFYNSSASGILDGGSGTNALNLPAGTVVNDDSEGTFTVVFGHSYTITDGTFTLPTGQTVTYQSFDEGAGITCFTRGTRIRGPKRDVNIEHLKVGDVISTFDGGVEKVRWIGRRRLGPRALSANSKLRPVRITAGALGNNLPERDLLVSRQHRILAQSRIAERVTGCSEVLVAAIKLTKLPGIFVDDTVETVEYFHLLLDQHKTIVAEGAASESLFTGVEGVNALGKKARDELSALFPQIFDVELGPEPDRLIPDNKRQKELVARHLKNNKPLQGCPATMLGFARCISSDFI